jgi:hypothetical protein
MVGNGPVRWELRISPGQADIKPHLYYVIITFGLGALRRHRHFTTSDVALHVGPKRPRRTRWFEFHDRKSGKKVFEFTDPLWDRYQDEIESKLRAAGF